jgi:hypothetical protein
MRRSMTRFCHRAGGITLLSLTAALFCGAPVAKADLIGSQVSIGIYCCNVPTPPDLSV